MTLVALAWKLLDNQEIANTIREMKTYTFNVYWQMVGTVRIEADSEDYARFLAEGEKLPINGSYIADSFEVGELREEDLSRA